MFEKQIKARPLECNHTKAQALDLPPYYQGSECATGSNGIATNTPCNQPSSPEEEFPLETAAVETRAMTKGTSNVADPTSTLLQHAAHIRERIRTSAGTMTCCSFCNTGGKHRSDRCLLKTDIGMHIKVDHEQALVSVTINLGMPPE